MASPQRFTNEQIIAAYQQTGSVWKAAKQLGACGQSVWERLRRLNYRLPGENWTDEEIEELRALASTCTIGEAARRLGRPYTGVASKISQLGIGVRFGNKVKTKVPRGSGFNKATTAKLAKELKSFSGSLRQFCTQRGFSVDIFVKALQTYDAGFWKEYVATHSKLPVKNCKHCRCEFVPMNGKQFTCSRRCQSLLRNDVKYFGGKRTNAIGLEEGVCQLCEKEKPRLAAHHVYGKENDPDNDYLIALCAGCHSLVGTLGVRSDAQSSAFWENLVGLVIARKLGHRQPIGFHVCVDIEEITQEQLDYEADCAPDADGPGEDPESLDVPGAKEGEMITREAKSEIRNLLVKANLALHRSDIGGLREMLTGAVHRVKALSLHDVEAGFSLPLDVKAWKMDDESN